MGGRLGAIGFSLILFTISSRADQIIWDELAPLPNPIGVAGAIAGCVNDGLVVAGGANFPEKKPWEGGSKVWHDDVWFLAQPAADWRHLGRLHQPLAYSVTVTDARGIVVVGGSNASGHVANVFRLLVQNGQVMFESLRALPMPIANASGVLIGKDLYLAGGSADLASTEALRLFLRLNLADPGADWETLPAWPGDGRMLATAAVWRDEFWLMGGVSLSPDDKGRPKRDYLRDVFHYHPDKGWRRAPDLPHALAAAPSPAVTRKDRLFILGGDDGSQLATPPKEHLGFRRSIVMWNDARNRWEESGTLARGVVTAPVVFWKDHWIIPSGEIAPGIRTPKVARLAFP